MTPWLTALLSAVTFPETASTFLKLAERMISDCPCLIRDDRRFKNGCFFGKVPKGGEGSFPIQKITLQILLVSKRYILEKENAI